MNENVKELAQSLLEESNEEKIPDDEMTDFGIVNGELNAICERILRDEATVDEYKLLADFAATIFD